MKQQFLPGAGFLSVLLVAGIVPASAALPPAPVASTASQYADARYAVSMDEIARTFVAHHPFTGGYTTTLTMSDGSKRTIKLTPLIKDGMLLVHLEDTINGKPAGPNGNSYMGPNGTTHDGSAANGTLMVKLQNSDYPPSAWTWVAPFKMAPANGVMPDPAKTRFLVSIYEIRKTVAFAQPFSDHYTKRVTMADDSQRTIDLTVERKDGKPVIKLDDTGRVVWLDPNGTAIDGKLMIQVGDIQPMMAAFRKWAPHHPAK